MTTEWREKIDTAVRRLQTFAPPEGYFVAFSGGKDSIVVKHLCDLAGVKYDAHYSVTSVDPPELVQYIKKQHPDVSFDIPHDKNGKPITMWSLIASRSVPPTRMSRYCCSKLKESSGKGRVTVTGVRWAESVRRKNNHGLVDFQNKPVGTKKIADKMGVQYSINKNKGIILNDDNDDSRRLVEQCYRTRKTIVNPIIDWTDDDVWDFVHEYNLPYCSLYDEGFKRLGCIGCPLSGRKNMIRDFERWPKYKDMYIRTFQKMIDNHPGEICILKPEYREEHFTDEEKRKFEELGGGVSSPCGDTASSAPSSDATAPRRLVQHTVSAVSQCYRRITDTQNIGELMMKYYIWQCYYQDNKDPPPCLYINKKTKPDALDRVINMFGITIDPS